MRQSPSIRELPHFINLEYILFYTFHICVKKLRVIQMSTQMQIVNMLNSVLLTPKRFVYTCDHLQGVS
jgi:hypothetical protein